MLCCAGCSELDAGLHRGGCSFEGRRQARRAWVQGKLTGTLGSWYKMRLSGVGKKVRLEEEGWRPDWKGRKREKNGKEGRRGRGKGGNNRMMDDDDDEGRE